MFEPSWIVLATPVELLSTCESMSGWADEVVWAAPPRRTSSEIWYDDASEPRDEEVRVLLESFGRTRQERVKFPRAPHAPHASHR